MTNSGLIKSKEFLPAMVALASAISGIILRFNLSSLNVIAFVLIAFVILCGFKQSWLLLPGMIIFLFALEPAPLSIGRNEFLFASFMGLFILLTYIQAIRLKQIREFKIVIYGSAIFFIIVGCSFFSTFENHITISEWARSIAPFLMLYMAFPVFLSLQSEFEFKTRWLFIAFCFFTLLILCYINIVFFLENFDKYYWINKQDGSIIFDITSYFDKELFFGPRRDRITLRIQQATSELLPISFSVFTLLALLTKSKKIYIFALLGACISLCSILETLTRSMLAAPLLVLFLWLAFNFDKNKFFSYLKVTTILLTVGITFTFATNLDDIWLGRFKTFLAGIHMMKYDSAKGFNTNDSPEYMSEEERLNVDQNLVARVKEYKIAWSIFLKNPLLGAGLGVKHNIEFQTTNGQFIQKNVGYVHNWIFYWLMVGGVFGLIFYSWVLCIPIPFISKLQSHTQMKTIIISTIFVMFLYASFFAVFRLISFNLILAIFSGIALFIWNKKQLLETDNKNLLKNDLAIYAH